MENLKETPESGTPATPELDRIYYERFLADMRANGTPEDVQSGLKGIKDQIKEAADAGTSLDIMIEGTGAFTERDREQLSAYRILAEELGYRIGAFDLHGTRAVAPVERVQQKTPEHASELDPQITAEAQNLLLTIESGVPAFISKKAEGILKAYGFPDEDIRSKTPDELFKLLKEKVIPVTEAKPAGQEKVQFVEEGLRGLKGMISIQDIETPEERKNMDTLIATETRKLENIFDERLKETPEKSRDLKSVIAHTQEKASKLGTKIKEGATSLGGKLGNIGEAVMKRFEKITVRSAQDISRAFDSLTAIEKSDFLVGIGKIGYKAQEWKGTVFSGLYGKLQETFATKNKAEEEQGSIVRFYGALKNVYEETAKKATADREKLDKDPGRLGTAIGIGTLAGNAALYGRTIMDFLAPSVANPLRYFTMGAMAVGRGAEAAKEATLQSAGKIEAERIDFKTAAEEAWKIYGEARAKNPQGEVTKEALKLAYAKDLPANILDRLANKPEGLAGNLMEKVVEYDLKRTLTAIYGSITDIEQSEKSPEQKRLELEVILTKHATFLRDVDRMVTKAGVIDLTAYGSKLLETGGKALAAGLAVETLAEGVWRLASWTGEIQSGDYEIHQEKEFKVKLPSTAFDQTGRLTAIGAHELASAVVTSAAEADNPLSNKELSDDVLATHGAEYQKSIDSRLLDERVNEIKEAAVVHKGEGIEHAFIRQIKLHPEEFGFKGDANDPKAVEQFANTKAHQIALQNGYVKAEGYLVTEETRVAKPETSLYVLHPDDKGGATVEVINKSEYTYREYEDLNDTQPADEDGEESSKFEAPESKPEGKKEDIQNTIQALSTNLNLPQNAFEGFEDKIAKLSTDDREALRLTLLWQDNPIDRWNPSSRHDLIETTIDRILTGNADDRKKILADFVEMRRHSADYSPETGRYYDENEDRAYQRLKGLLFDLGEGGPETVQPPTPAVSESAPAIPAESAPTKTGLTKEEDVAWGQTLQRFQEAKIPKDYFVEIQPKELAHMSRENILDIIAKAQNAEIEHLDKAQRAALDLASRDLGLSALGPTIEDMETRASYLTSTLDIFHSKDPARLEQWIEGGYRSMLEGDLKRGDSFVDGKPLTQAYIDAHVKELRADLLNEKELPAPTGKASVLLENIVGRTDQPLGINAISLATQLQNQSITPEDFTRYYAEKTAGGKNVSETILRQLRETIDKTKNGTSQERGMAQRSLTVIAQRLLTDIAASKK